MNDKPEIKPGTKWTLANGYRAFVAIKHGNKWLGGWIHPSHKQMLPFGLAWDEVGKNFGDNPDYDLASPGWPVELRDGGWYDTMPFSKPLATTDIRLQGLLRKNPGWFSYTWELLWRQDDGGACTFGATWVTSDGWLSGSNRRITEELPEPPAWAKEGA